MSEIASRETSVPSVCSKCSVEHFRKGQRYCLACHNAYSRLWRKTAPISAEQEIKIAARNFAAIAKKRGKLVQSPCERCGSEKSEMHHHDYSKPLEVNWLCRPCHMAIHAEDRAGLEILCKCGATRTNPKDAYCKGCRAAASSLARARLREELQRLRAASKTQEQRL